MTGGLIALASFIVAIALLVAVHEFGHFYAARRLGIQVLRFSIGFGRPLWSRHGRDGVEYVIGALPIGGYVKFLDERDADGPLERPERAFNRAAPWRRAIVLVAGPAANLLFAVAAYWAILVSGIPGERAVIGEVVAGSAAAAAGLRRDDEVVAVGGVAVGSWGEVSIGLLDAVLAGERSVPLTVRGAEGAPQAARIALEDGFGLTEPGAMLERLGLRPWSYAMLEPVIGRVVPDGAAARAGLEVGDRFTTFDGAPVAEWGDVARSIHERPGRTVVLVVMRKGMATQATVEVKSVEVRGHPVGFIGIEPQGAQALRDRLSFERRFGLVEAAPEAVRRTYDLSVLTVKMIGRMLTGGASLANISGPINIAQYAGATASLGMTQFLGFLAVISLSLGVLNLLPIPILDGGQLAFLAVETAMGRPVTPGLELAGQQVGIVLLVGLMGLAFYNDVVRLIG